jgi:Flp pilus assembly protein TadB
MGSRTCGADPAARLLSALNEQRSQAVFWAIEWQILAWIVVGLVLVGALLFLTTPTVTIPVVIIFILVYAYRLKTHEKHRVLMIDNILIGALRRQREERNNESVD